MRGAGWKLPAAFSCGFVGLPALRSRRHAHALPSARLLRLLACLFAHALPLARPALPPTRPRFSAAARLSLPPTRPRFSAAARLSLPPACSLVRLFARGAFCTKTPLFCEGIVCDSTNSMKLGNNSRRFGIACDIFGTVKAPKWPNSPFLHNLLAISYKK